MNRDGGVQRRMRGQLTSLDEDLHGGRCMGMLFEVVVDMRRLGRECEWCCE